MYDYGDIHSLLLGRDTGISRYEASHIFLVHRVPHLRDEPPLSGRPPSSSLSSLHLNFCDRSYNNGEGCSVGDHVEAGDRGGRSTQVVLLTLMGEIRRTNGRIKPRCEPRTNESKEPHRTTTTHLRVFKRSGWHGRLLSASKWTHQNAM